MKSPIPLNGFAVKVSENLAGHKRAIRMSNTIFVSPAMRDLMVHATPDELEKLLDNIELIDCSPFNPFKIQ